MARGVRTRTAAWLAAALLLMGAGAAGCGDDSGGTATPSKTPQAAESSPDQPSSPAATDEESSGSGGAEAGGQPADPEAAEQEVRKNWTTFFAADSDAEEKQAVLENGDEMAPLLEAFAGDERWKQVAAEVDTVEFTSAEEAEVTYAITLQGNPVVPDASGVSVLQDGTWKVSVKAICSLISLSGSPAPGC